MLGGVPLTFSPIFVLLLYFLYRISLSLSTHLFLSLPQSLSYPPSPSIFLSILLSHSLVVFLSNIDFEMCLSNLRTSVSCRLIHHRTLLIPPPFQDKTDR